MKIDLAILVLILFFGGFGLYTGAIRQLAHIGALIIGYFAARPIGQIVGPVLAQKYGYPLLLTSIACSFVAFFALYVLCDLMLRHLLTKLFPEGEHGNLNRFGGFILGAAKSAAIIFIALSGLVLVDKHVGRLWRDYRDEARASKAIELARRHNVFARLPQFAGLKRLLEASQDPKAAARLGEDPEFKALARDARTRSLTNDAAVKRAFETGDYGALLSSLKVLELLNDPKASERLRRLAGTSLPAEAEDPEGPQ